MNTFTKRFHQLILVLFCLWTSQFTHAQQTIDNAIIGRLGSDLSWSGMRHSSLGTSNYAILQRNDGAFTLINKANTGNGYIGFRVGNNPNGSIDKMVILNDGRVGIGTTSPAYLLHVAGGDVFSNWYRSSGNNGWYNETHGGGIYMADGHWIRTYGGKNFYHDRGAMRTDGTLQVGPDGNTLSVTNFGAFNYGQGKMVMATDGILQIKNMAGIGDRPVYADANGKLKIGSGGTVIGAGVNEQVKVRNLNIYNSSDKPVGAFTSLLNTNNISLRNDISQGYLAIETNGGSIFMRGNNSAQTAIEITAQNKVSLLNCQVLNLGGSTPSPVFTDNSGNLYRGTIEAKWAGSATSDLNMNGRNIINNVPNNSAVTTFKSSGTFGKIILEGSTGSDIELKGTKRSWNINNNDGRIAIQTIISNGVYKAPLVIHENGVAAIELKVKVDAKTAYPDFVFEPDYDLMPLSSLESYLKENKHLPEVKSVAEVVADDSQINVAEYTLLLLKKVEELTLYAIQQQKELDALKKQISNK